MLLLFQDTTLYAIHYLTNFCKAKTTHVSTKIAQRYSVHKGTLRSHNYVVRTLHSMSPGLLSFQITGSDLTERYLRKQRQWTGSCDNASCGFPRQCPWETPSMPGLSVYSLLFLTLFLVMPWGFPFQTKETIQPLMINDYQSAGLCNCININHNSTEGVIWLCYE